MLQSFSLVWMICDVLLRCDGAAGASWSVSTATSLTSEGADSGGASVEESAGTDAVSETTTVFSTGDETSMADGGLGK